MGVNCVMKTFIHCVTTSKCLSSSLYHNWFSKSLSINNIMTLANCCISPFKTQTLIEIKMPSRNFNYGLKY